MNQTDRTQERKSLLKVARSATLGKLPKTEGEFETGCHTPAGNDLCLYAQTTRELHEKREQAFKTTLEAKAKWKGGEFNAVMQLDRKIQEWYADTVIRYRRELQADIELEDTTYEDFFNWAIREFNRYEVEQNLQKPA